MSENQRYKLQRSLFIAGIGAGFFALLLLWIAVDIVLYEQAVFNWITADNYIPIIATITFLSMPFWVLGALAEQKLRTE